MVPMFGTQSVTFWYPHDLPQSHTPVRPLNPYLPLSLTLKGRGGSARPSATIASHPRRPRVSIARPSDGPTDPSRRSRGADPALERETNKITKDDRRARFSAPRAAAPALGGDRRPRFLAPHTAAFRANGVHDDRPPRLRAQRGTRSAKSN